MLSIFANTSVSLFLRLQDSLCGLVNSVGDKVVVVDCACHMLPSCFVNDVVAGAVQVKERASGFATAEFRVAREVS